MGGEALLDVGGGFGFVDGVEGGDEFGEAGGGDCLLFLRFDSCKSLNLFTEL